jgi:hypothetical protein
MKTIWLALIASFACTSMAVAEPLDAPTINVFASNIKQLQFDITPVTRINWYELWFKADSGAAWVKYAQTIAQRPRFRINVSVHLLNWQQARFYVKACNAGACSQSNEVGVDGEQLAAMGYFKPYSTLPNQYLGFEIAVSGDGMTMAAINQTRLNHQTVGIIHVFRRTSPTSGWHLDARLYPNPNIAPGGLGTGNAVSLSGDGNTLVTANWAENGTTGAVYLFRRDDSGWHQAQRITGSAGNDHFGIRVKLDAPGKTLIIGRDQDAGVHREGTLDVYKVPDDGGDKFVYATTIPTPDFIDPRWGWCRGFGLSADGTVVHACFSGASPSYFTRVLTPTSSVPLQYMETARLPDAGGAEHAGIDAKGEQIFTHDYVQGSNFVTMWRRSGSGWVKDAKLAPFKVVNAAAISADGQIMALAFMNDDLLGRGPLFPPYQVGAQTGTVAIYDHRPTGWRLRRFVKPDTPQEPRGFGWSVALNDNGHLLAVGSPYDDSTATGINGNREDASGTDSGAIWLY